jgi:hypothetical protein
MHHPTSLFALLGLAPMAASLLGCSPNQAAGDAGANDTVSCTPETGSWPIDTYTANMSRAGHNGILTFAIVKSEPAPPHQGNNTITVKITHMDGTPFTGTLTAPNNSKEGIWMPVHIHGSTIRDTVTPLDPSQGTFTLSSVDLFMTGYWQIRLNALEVPQSSDAGALTDGGGSMSQPVLIDFAAFFFCI